MSALARSTWRISLPADVWGRIVLTAQESDDWRLKTLIEQAVMEARTEDEYSQQESKP